MGHKAGTDFFSEKREWSKRKDRILGSYLAAYLPKISTVRKPVLIVDGFSGPGKFGDNEPGSPLIIASRIRAFQRKNVQNPINVDLLCIEENPELYNKLSSIIDNIDFAKSICGTFQESLPIITQASKSHSVFVYADPFTVDGLDWEKLGILFSQIHRGNSVEILLNFNASIFARIALAAQKQTHNLDEELPESINDVDASAFNSQTIDNLDRVVGGNWWKPILDQYKDPLTFDACLSKIVNGLKNNLSQYFSEVCSHDMYAEPNHRVPKYTLVFGSRSTDALRLMNDEMAKSLATLADKSASNTPSLFEMRPIRLVPDVSEYIPLILSIAQKPTMRKHVILQVIRENFGQVKSSEIRGQIEKLLKDGRLISKTGKTRINDEVAIWTSK